MKRLSENLYLTSEGLIFNSKKQTLKEMPNFLIGITTKGHNLWFDSYETFLKQSEGVEGVFPVFVEKIFNRGKTTYAKCLDNNFIAIGSRPVKNNWIKYNYSFEAGKANLIFARKDENYDKGIMIKGVHVLKHT